MSRKERNPLTIYRVKPLLCPSVSLEIRPIRSGIGNVARQLRIEYPGAVYHGLSRGDRKGPIFLDEGACHDFIKTLDEARQKAEFEMCKAKV